MSIRINDQEKKLEELSKEEFIAAVLLQIWKLGSDPDMCLAYCLGMKQGLFWTGNKDMWENDLETLIDLVEFYEQAGQIPETYDEILDIVKQYYGEKQ